MIAIQPGEMAAHIAVFELAGLPILSPGPGSAARGPLRAEGGAARGDHTRQTLRLCHRKRRHRCDLSRSDQLCYVPTMLS